jgi:hypothetical protein
MIGERFKIDQATLQALFQKIDKQPLVCSRILMYSLLQSKT